MSFSTKVRRLHERILDLHVDSSQAAGYVNERGEVCRSTQAKHFAPGVRDPGARIENHNPNAR